MKYLNSASSLIVAIHAAQIISQLEPCFQTIFLVKVLNNIINLYCHYHAQQL